VIMIGGVERLSARALLARRRTTISAVRLRRLRFLHAYAEADL